MASSILRLAKKLRNLKEHTPLLSLRRCLSTENSEPTRTSRKSREILMARIIPLGQPSISMVPILDQWAQEGNEISSPILRVIVEALRRHRRYGHALQVLEWMSKKGLSPFSPSDHAICVDLIGKVRGLKSAESYFNGLSDTKENSKVYGALLNCYAGQNMVEKSLSHMQKMKDLGFVNSFSYNAIISLYKNTNQLDKIPDLFSEMKETGVVPDGYSYRLCIDAYGMRSDLESLEMILNEMETQPNIKREWNTYAMVANFFVKANDRETSLMYLNKCEELVGNDALGYNFLISYHTTLGHKDEVMRLWGVQKAKCKSRVNRDYITMLGSVVKLGAFEEGEQILEEWLSTCSVFDFRVPNTLLIGYCQKWLTEKAESTLRKIVAKGKTPVPNSWAIVAAGYLGRKKNMNKALECIKEAMAVRGESVRWRPKTWVTMEILNWLVDSADVEEVEAYVGLLKNAVPVSEEMYRALIRAYVKAGKEVDGVLERMKSDGIDLDEETLTGTILSSKKL